MPSDDAFVALANPVRRRLLELLADRARTAGELAEPFDLSRPAVAEHLQVLRAAGLVRDERRGRHRLYHLVADPLADVEDWLHPFERFWRHRLTVLTDLLENTVPESSATEAAMTLSVDQFIAVPPATVWRALTDPELLARWWVPGDVAAKVGHTFTLAMPGWGDVACRVIEADEPRRFVFTFADWTLSWSLVAEGTGTRLLLDQSGFDHDDPRSRAAFERMGPGWREQILPALADLAVTL